MAEKEVKLKVVAETETTDIDALEQQISEMDNSTIKVDADDTEITTLEEEIENLKLIIEEETAYGFDTSESEAQLTELEAKLDEFKSKAEEGTSLNFDDGGAGGTIDDLNAGLEGMNDLMVGDVLKQYGDSAEGMAQQMNQANISVGQLSKNVGMAEPQMVSLINNISNKTFPQNEAMAYVNTLNQMGVSADKLGDSATNMDRINDATGIGYNNVMQLTTGLQSMGVTADNLPSAFNAIAYAEANLSGGTATFQQVVKRQAGTINEYGLSADQVVVALSTLQSQTGLTGMKLGSEFGKKLEECGGDLSLLEQELGLTEGALTNASQTTGAYEGQIQSLADEEMEHKTILDDISALWEDVALAIGGVASPVMSLVGLGGSVAGFGMQLNGVWELTRKLRDVKAFGGLKTALIDIGTSAKTSALNMLSLAKNTLMAGLNALKSAGMWLAQKASLVASTVATWAQTVADWALNSSLLANPITWIVIALIALAGALIWAYYNVDWFREMVDNAWASLVQLAQYIYTNVMGAIQWLSDLFNQFTSQLGLNTNDWLQSLLGFILFLPTLPIQVGIALVNTIAQMLGFGNNFVQGMINTASNAINGFISYIQQLPSIVMGEFNRVLGLVNDFINTLPQKVWDMGVAIIDALKGALGIGSPGHMFYMIEGEFNRIDELTKKTNFDTGSIGQQMVDNFNPNLNASADGSTGATGNNITINIENVDNEERIQQIVKAVEDALKFDNLTAGRTA